MGLIKKLFPAKKDHLVLVAKSETVSRVEHDALLNELRSQLAQALNDRRVEGLVNDNLSRRHRKLQDDLATARAEAAANAAELAQWRQYGRMTDPQTGRLVPRVKAEVEANV